VPRKEFVAFNRLDASDVNTFLMDQSVMSFAGTAARGSAIATPVEGMAAYLNDSNIVSLYDGSNWKTSLSITGGILQVVSATKVDAFSSTSTSFTDIPGLSLSITPKSSTSKILVILNTYTSLSATGDTLVNLVRDSTAISQSTGASNNATMVGRVPDFAGIANTTAVFLDEPATTSATTYKAQMRVIVNTGFINRRGADTGFGLTSSITALEVSA
jgi:hypothetical protein